LGRDAGFLFTCINNKYNIEIKQGYLR